MACCPTCGSTRLPCGCCAGTQPLTPAAIFNRPGLDHLAWRVGTHGSFFQTMKARLATVEVDDTRLGGPAPQHLRPLRALTTRDSSDFSIALLDGWATVADLLTFYQERIADEGYLRTATERRSVLELANLVGYSLRPGVSASVFLAYTLDDNQVGPTTIAAGARSQSLPGPGEAPQSFETSEDLIARREWNDLKVRLRRPQHITPATSLSIQRIVVSDAVSSLRAGDPLLLLFSTDGSLAAMRSVRSTEGPTADGRSTIHLDPIAPALAATIGLLLDLVNALQPALGGADGATSRAIRRAQALQQSALLDHDGDPAAWAGSVTQAADGTIAAPVLAQIATFANAVSQVLAAIGAAPVPARSSPDQFVRGLLAPPVAQVAGSVQLRRDLGRTFVPGADAAPQLLLNFAPQLRDSYYRAWQGAAVDAAPPALLGVFRLKASASLFGSAVPRQVQFSAAGVPLPQSQWLEWTLDASERADAAYLDQLYPAIAEQGGYAVVTRLDGTGPASQVLPVTQAAAAQRTAYGISGKSSRLQFGADWWAVSPNLDISVLRSTLVRAQSEALTLLDEPIRDAVGSTEGDTGPLAIELGALYDELTSGRWVILSGERADLPGVAGVQAAELMMISGLAHDYDHSLPGDTTHTTLHLATRSAYVYKRESLVIYGNVVHATNGETRTETLGSGDGTAAWQTFTLKQPPLTFVSAPTAAGAASTLEVYVDELLWHESPSLAWLGPADRGYVSRTDDSGQVTVTFGDGAHGARLPTGVQNVRAAYRSGIGAPGNVAARQISLLTTRPLGVKAVINPLRASGGAGREERDLARENAPLAVMALDRLVSVQDYADFARTYAGIAKAAATRTTDGRRELVYLTIAGVDDTPIDPTSDLYRNLRLALRALGDLDQPVVVAPRELRTLVLSAGIALQPDYRWETVAAAVRAELLQAFGFGRRALGQSARLAEVIAAIQGVPGVAWLDVDAFGSIPEKSAGADGQRRLITQAGIEQQVAVALGITRLGAGAAVRSPALPPDVIAFAGGNDRGLLRPAELAIFTGAVADTLILNRLS